MIETHSMWSLGGLRRGVEQLGTTASFTARVIAVGLRRPPSLRSVVDQVDAVGIRSISIVVLTAVFSAMVLTLQFGEQLTRFGAREWTGNVVSLSLARELAPVMTALMVGGRVGAGIAAELGSMAVTDQIDAVRALGADPIRRLVVPRVVAITLSMPLLSTMALVLGVAGGAFINAADGYATASHFYNAALRSVGLADFLSGFFKTIFFGFQIGVIACQRGMATRGGTLGVGRATTETVVTTSVVTLVSDFFLTRLFMAVG